MPPKKAQKKTAVGQKRENQKEEENSGQDTNEIRKQQEDDSPETAAQKRKEPPTHSGSSSKALKTKSSSCSKPLIEFLLSPKGLELCRNPTSEPSPDLDSKETRRDYLSADLTPFEDLVCAVILSRPISHNLGQRTIATVLNEPWSWNNAQKILDAGRENEDGKTLRVEAMEVARTQHRQKTASELGGLAHCIVDEKWDEDEDGSLEGLRKQVGDQEGEFRENLRALVKGKVKGLGDTGLDIFLRRVQGHEGWEGIGWFVDKKTRDALGKVGLPDDPDDLKQLFGNDRADFVVVLERTLGIVLEGKQAELKEQA